MQASKTSWQKAGLPVLVVAVIAGVLVLSNRTTTMPNGQPNIVGPSDYQDALRQAIELSKSGVTAFNSGADLTQKDKDDLLSAAKILDNMDNFKPDEAAGFFEAGLCYYIVGDTDTAKLRVEQALANSNTMTPPLTAKDRADLAGVIGDSYHTLGLIAFDKHDYKTALQEINEGLKHVQRANMYVSRARVELQLNEKDKAKADIATAFKIDPVNPQAHRLEGFFKD